MEDLQVDIAQLEAVAVGSPGETAVADRQHLVGDLQRSPKRRHLQKNKTRRDIFVEWNELLDID